MSESKKKYQRKPKEQRKNKKLWADGARETVLNAHLPGYADALSRGWRAERDYFDMVCNEFHSRIPWRLPDHEEPPLPLAPYDPTSTPEVEILTPEEQLEKHVKIQDLNKRIARWLKYRVRRLRKGFTKGDDAKNPFVIIASQLAGIKPPHKARQGFQQFMHEDYSTVIKPVVDARWAAQSVGDDGSVNTRRKSDSKFRTAVARELYNALPLEVQERYRAAAAAEAKEAKEAFEKALKEGPSKSPEAKQRAIDNFGPFIAPIMRAIQDATGLHVLVIVGGPIPKQNGAIQTIQTAFGHNHAPMPVSIPAWDKERFNRDVIGYMKAYLETAYTSQERAEVALVPDDPLAEAQYRMSQVDDDGNANLDSSSESDDDSDDDDDSELDDDGGHKRKRVKVGDKRKKENRAPLVPPPASTSFPIPTLYTPGPPPPESVSPAVAAPDPPIETEEEREWRLELERARANEKQRRANIRRNQALLDSLNLRNTTHTLEGKKKPSRVRKPKEKPAGVESSRRRTRSTMAAAAAASAGGDHTEGQVAVDGRSGDGRGADGVETNNGVDVDAERADVRSTSGSGGGGADIAEGDRSREDVEMSDGADAVRADAHTGGGSTNIDAGEDAEMRDAANTEETRREQEKTDIGPNPSTPDVETLPASNGVPPASSDVQMALHLPSDAPAWLRRGFEDLTRDNLGPVYVELVNNLVALERAYKFFNGMGKLSTTSRPKQLHWWMKYGRDLGKAGTYIAVADLTVYEKEWWAWWAANQPVWRERGSNGRFTCSDTYGKDWGLLATRGQNGMLVVVTSLCIWGRAESAACIAPLSDAWHAAATDVNWALKGLQEAAIRVGSA